MKKIVILLAASTYLILYTTHCFAYDVYYNIKTDIHISKSYDVDYLNNDTAYNFHTPINLSDFKIILPSGSNIDLVSLWDYEENTPISNGITNNNEITFSDIGRELEDFKVDLKFSLNNNIYYLTRVIDARSPIITLFYNDMPFDNVNFKKSPSWSGFKIVLNDRSQSEVYFAEVYRYIDGTNIPVNFEQKNDYFKLSDGPSVDDIWYKLTIKVKDEYNNINSITVDLISDHTAPTLTINNAEIKPEGEDNIFVVHDLSSFNALDYTLNDNADPDPFITKIKISELGSEDWQEVSKDDSLPQKNLQGLITVSDRFGNVKDYKLLIDNGAPIVNIYHKDHILFEGEMVQDLSDISLKVIDVNTFTVSNIKIVVDETTYPIDYYIDEEDSTIVHLRRSGVLPEILTTTKNYEITIEVSDSINKSTRVVKDFYYARLTYDQTVNIPGVSNVPCFANEDGYNIRTLITKETVDQSYNNNFVVAIKDTEIPIKINDTTIEDSINTVLPVADNYLQILVRPLSEVDGINYILFVPEDPNKKILLIKVKFWLPHIELDGADKIEVQPIIEEFKTPLKTEGICRYTTDVEYAQKSSNPITNPICGIEFTKKPLDIKLISSDYSYLKGRILPSDEAVAFNVYLYNFSHPILLGSFEIPIQAKEITDISFNFTNLKDEYYKLIEKVNIIPANSGYVRCPIYLQERDAELSSSSNNFTCLWKWISIPEGLEQYSSRQPELEGRFTKEGNNTISWQVDMYFNRQLVLENFIDSNKTINVVIPDPPSIDIEPGYQSFEIE